MKPKLYVAIFLWVIFLKINVVLKQEELVLGPSSPIDCLQLKSSVCTPPLYYFHKSWIETPDVLEHFEYDAMLIKGYAKWDISPASLVAKKACDLPSTKQTPTIDVTIAESLPGKLKLSDDPALRFSSEDRGDYICLFVLGWSYILSVRLIDLHGKDSDDRVSYTGNLAESYVNGNKPESSRVAIDLNVVTEDHAELRWWIQFLLMAKAGRQYFPKEYRPLWEFHLRDACFILSHNVDLQPHACQPQPPSSEEAQNNLFNFARLNGIFYQLIIDQLIIGLASVMTLPSCNRWGNHPKYLPMPRKPTKSCESDITEALYHDNLPSLSEIPNFMALSAFPVTIGPGLANSLWEQDISCNLVSEWLNPVFKDIIPLLLQKKYHKTIVCAMSERRPIWRPFGWDRLSRDCYQGCLLKQRI
ncbi:hypothetical protein N7509_001608 [Penicillium cosmopolitanum]|uniref:Ig-like domain-containing protein n=1 Tax=Penicillium cosmopolitanum TaxID=1131564 RepID=A0A9W9W7T4_9EURO|nr:uncharacterized protein N7509_001608 [Penicillium cosmopolitanum]KAJ5407725.1 hypothetical protein N7509_001608 [Penicillium cosmopolitanum]